MKLRNIFISAGLLLASCACAFAGALASKKELVETSAESVSTITIDTFTGVRSKFSPMNVSETVDLQGYIFKYRNAASASDRTYGYDAYDALSFLHYEEETARYINNQTAMPGVIKSITLHTHSAQELLAITYNVAFGTSAFGGMGEAKDRDPYEMFGGESHTFTNSVTGATFFAISCNAYEITEGAHVRSCLDKIEISYVVDQAKTDATTFAQTFINTTNGICKDTSIDIVDTDVDALAAVWNIKATPDGNSLVEKWNALSNGAKSVFTAGTANATIADANARYVHIMSRYSGTLTAFAGGPALTYSAQALSALSVNDSNNSALIITGIASAGLLSTVGFLFVRRRREN